MKLAGAVHSEIVVSDDRPVTTPNSEIIHRSMALDAPAKAELRTFNENDIIGDFDRDSQGKVVVSGSTDKNGKSVNQRGYFLH